MARYVALAPAPLWVDEIRFRRKSGMSRFPNVYTEQRSGFNHGFQVARFLDFAAMNSWSLHETKSPDFKPKPILSPPYNPFAPRAARRAGSVISLEQKVRQRGLSDVVRLASLWFYAPIARQKTNLTANPWLGSMLQRSLLGRCQGQASNRCVHLASELPRPSLQVQIWRGLTSEETLGQTDMVN